MFEAIEEEDRVIEKDQGLPPALLGSCNDRAKQLHASPPGSFLPALFSIPNPTFLLLLPSFNIPSPCCYFTWPEYITSFHYGCY